MRAEERAPSFFSCSHSQCTKVQWFLSHQCLIVTTRIQCSTFTLGQTAVQGLCSQFLPNEACAQIDHFNKSLHAHLVSSTHPYLVDKVRKMSREPVNIVVLGGSFAGLSVAHNFLKKIVDQLGTTRTAPRYRLVLVSPSTHLYWNIGAPRALISRSLVPHTQSFLSIVEAFRDYPINRFSFVHGSAIGVDFSQRTVTVSVHTEPTQPIKNASIRDSYVSRVTSGSGNTRHSTQTIPFHALIIATGSSAESPLLSLHGPHQDTMSALDAFHAGLRDASSIIIVGGGPSGVECAGQLATYFKTRSSPPADKPAPSAAKSRFSTYSAAHPKRTSTGFSIFSRRRFSAPAGLAPADRTPKHITLFSGAERLLTRLPPAVGKQAEAKLRRAGVHVVHNVRLVSAVEKPSGNTVCVFNKAVRGAVFGGGGAAEEEEEEEEREKDEYAVSCDLFVAATGVRPNTDFLPPELLDASNYVQCDAKCLRVQRAGERVYAVGDCAAYSKNNILDVYESVPPLLHNLKNDLWAYEIKRQNPFGGERVMEQIEQLEDIEYVQERRPTQMCPMTRWGGVGVLFGVKLPSWAVHIMKGRDYRVGKAKSVVEKGLNPYASPA